MAKDFKRNYMGTLTRVLQDYNVNIATLPNLRLGIDFLRMSRYQRGTFESAFCNGRFITDEDGKVIHVGSYDILPNSKGDMVIGTKKYGGFYSNWTHNYNLQRGITLRELLNGKIRDNKSFFSIVSFPKNNEDGIKGCHGFKISVSALLINSPFDYYRLGIHNNKNIKFVKKEV